MPSQPILTSQNNPLRIAAVSAGLGMGAVGVTICPGKQQAQSISGCWARDLDTDLQTIADWGAAAVVSLMPMDELAWVKVGHMGEACEAHGMDWFHLPIEDLQAPDARFEVHWHYAGLRLRELLRRGRNVLVHCRGGLGRSGTVAARLLVELGWSPTEAMAQVRKVRPGAIETPVQAQHLQQLAGPIDPQTDARLSRVHGCVLGGAVGDAFGYAVEFDPLSAIVKRHGRHGLQEPVYQRGQLQVSDDTQMTLFTLEAINAVLAAAKPPSHAPDQAGHAASSGASSASPDAFAAACRQAYLRWGNTQGVRTPDFTPEGAPPMHLSPALRQRRAPGNTCLSAVAAGLGGRVDAPINDSKGCGAVMRTAPIGLLGLSMPKALNWGNVAGALTHGHIDGWLPGGILAALVQQLMAGQTLEDALAPVLGEAERLSTPESKVVGLLRATQTRAQQGAPRESTPLTADEVALLGEGWVGEEALALAVYAALTQSDFKAAIRMATNHSGDSDSTASIAGQLCGTRDGVLAVPQAWVRRLDVLDDTLALLEEFAALS